jgi:hypothetical protein
MSASTPKPPQPLSEILPKGSRGMVAKVKAYLAKLDAHRARAKLH